MTTIQLDKLWYFTGSYAKVGSIPNWIFDEEKYALLLEEQEIEKIRAEREEAFKLIDKYQLVLIYNNLTEDQKEELSLYREFWLDAPKTKIIPTKLDWLV